jgi:hypothetical protein
MYIYFFQLSIYNILCIYPSQLPICATLYMYENLFNVRLLYSTHTHLFVAVSKCTLAQQFVSFPRKYISAYSLQVMSCSQLVCITF